MMKGLSIIVLVACFFSVNSQGFEDSENEILVLLDSWINRDSYSTFLSSFIDRGYSLKFKVADDPNLTILRFKDYAYKTVIILAPNVRLFGGALDVRSLVKFVNDGGNLILAGDSNIGEAIRELGSEFGVEFDAQRTSVIDHFNFDVKSDAGLHTRLLIDSKYLVGSEVIVGKAGIEPLLYEGVGISSDPKNPLLIDILSASETAYSYEAGKPVSDQPNMASLGVKLIVALQARNNARVVMLGSVKFLTDRFMHNAVEHSSSKKSFEKVANRRVAEALGKWFTHDAGVLRVKQVKHHRVGEVSPPWEYTVTENLHYSIDIEQKDERGRWIPYVANDVQVSLIRIDPFIRKVMQHSGNHYSIDMMLPDVYGVFKLVVDYHRAGYSYLSSVTQISIRPLKHTQYERFIQAAYPYYASAISMVVGVFLFSFVYLYNRDEKSGQRAKSD